MARIDTKAIARAVALFAPSEVVERLADYCPERRDYVDEPHYNAAVDVWAKREDARWCLVGMTSRAKDRFCGDCTSDGEPTEKMPGNETDRRLAEAAPKEYTAYHGARDHLCAIAPGALNLLEAANRLAEDHLLALALVQPDSLLENKVADETLKREAPHEYLALKLARKAFMADEAAVHGDPEHQAWQRAAAQLRRRQPDTMADYEAAEARLYRCAPMDFFLWLMADDDCFIASWELITNAPRRFDAYVAANERLAKAAPEEYRAAFAIGAI